MKKILLLFSIVLTAIQILPAQNDLGQKLPVDKNVKTGVLKNGMTYYIRQNSRPEKKMELRLVINAGSILEDDDQQGLAHFTEHMAFNGSKNFKKNDLVSFLQTIGVEFGADLNAYTGFDETVYILPIPTEKKENVEKGFQILEDWASTVAFDDKELEKERGIVLEEERMGKGADERIFRVTYPKMFEGSKYAVRLPIGKPEIIKTFKQATIKRFYHDWYRPDLMAVIAVGDFNSAEIEKLIHQHFDHLTNPVKEKVRSYADVPARKNSEALVVTDREATNHVIQVYYPYQSVKPRETVADYREFIVRALFRSMLNQRMQELTQQAQPPFIFGASSISGWARGYENFNTVAYLSSAGPAPAIDALIQENERARKFGFTEDELTRIKKMMMKNMERSFNERDKSESSDYAEEYIENFLEHEPIPGIETEYEYFKKYLPEISLDEVNRKAKELIPPAGTPKLMIFTGPDSASFAIPTTAELSQMVSHAEQIETTAYQEKVIATSLLDKLPTPGKIVDIKADSLLETTRLSLSNGTQVILKSTDFKNDQIVMVGSRPGGQYLFDVSDRTNIEYAAPIVSQMGVGKFSPLDLRKFLAGKNASVSVRIGTISESASGQCSVEDFETMLQLLYLNFTAPRTDTALFQSFVNKQKSYYENMDKDPEFIFQDSLFRILYGNHPWAPRLPKPSTFDKLDLGKILEKYRSRFSNAYGFTFVFTGKIDVDQMKPLLETYIGGLPAVEQNNRFTDVGLRPVKGVVKKEIRKGVEQKSVVRLFWNGETTYSEKSNLVLNTLVEVLNIKITESLREEMGGMYSGDVYGSVNMYPYNHYAVGMTLPCGPENVQRLIEGALKEIDLIKRNGPSETDLNKVKETKKQQHMVDLKENSYWARKLLQSVEQRTDPASILSFEKNLNSVTAAEVKEAANKFFDMKNFVQVVLNPEVIQSK